MNVKIDNSLFIPLLTVFIFWSCSKTDGVQVNDGNRYPSLHFTHQENWTGEPAGALYYEGEYHIFYQCNPEQANYNNIHIGHAVSKDLVHWEILPLALNPDSLKQIYPGCVVVDVENSSGYGTEHVPPFLAYYTYYNEDNDSHSLSMAYSLDKGSTWVECHDLEVSKGMEGSFQKPSLFWHDVSKSWIMTTSTTSSLKLFGSNDCKKWTFLSEFRIDSYNEGGWGTSSLFPLAIPDADLDKWVLAISMRGGPANGAPAVRYFVGDFDGKEFKITQGEELWIDYSKDFNGAMVFNNAPREDKIMMAWMNCWYYAGLQQTESWHGSLTFPRSLRLVSEGHYYTVASSLIGQLNENIEQIENVGERKISGNCILFDDLSHLDNVFNLRLVFDNANRYAFWSSKDYGIRLKTESGKTLTVGYKADLRYFYIDRSQLTEDSLPKEYTETIGVPYLLKEETVDWNILCDRGSIELLVCDGEISMTSLFYTKENFVSIELFTTSGDITLKEATIFEVKKNE